MIISSNKRLCHSLQTADVCWQKIVGGLHTMKILPPRGYELLPILRSASGIYVLRAAGRYDVHVSRPHPIHTTIHMMVGAIDPAPELDRLSSQSKCDNTKLATS